MFRMGGAAEGITSGLDRKPLANGTDPYDEAIKTTKHTQHTTGGLNPVYIPASVVPTPSAVCNGVGLGIFVVCV